MAQLLLSNQEKYTPVRVQNGETEVLDSVPFHGDQLFEERARNTQWTYQDGVNPFDRLEGIETEFADWHAKYNLYMVITLQLVNYFFFSYLNFLFETRRMGSLQLFLICSWVCLLNMSA